MSDTPLETWSKTFAKRGQGHPKNREELKNKQESMSWNGVNCKQVKEEPADPETHEICHVTKFGNWEFESLEAFVKGETEPRLTGHYEETPQAEGVESYSSKLPHI